MSHEKEESMKEGVLDGAMSAVSSIVGTIPDPRRGNHRRHSAHDMLFAAVVAVMCGYDSYRLFSAFADVNLEWMRARGCAFANGVPSHDAFCWLFRRLDPSLLSACLRSVARALRKRAGLEIVAIDGKGARRGKDRGGKTPFIVNAWSDAGGFVLGEAKVDDKSNEITAVPELLRLLDLEGCVVTIDAMGCQKAIAAKLFSEKKAHYVFALKDNQRTMHEEMRLLFESELKSSPGLFRSATEEARKAHGRIERRTCHQTECVGWFQDRDEWAGLRSVIMVESERTTRNAEIGAWETSTERRLYVSSLPVDPALALKATRRHWGVESMHWTLDVTFGEDYCRARREHAAENRATVRRIALNLLRRYGRRHECGTKKAMMLANQMEGALDEMLDH